ncbi:hypothetical protein Tco_0771131 [Tanacetum coccineum]|uniref:Uncharacterized protein n=1 Tax=Tanacetum coccineum TaxID=301880 RepID=A0ABQ4ZHH7_9ASTR
MCTKLLEIVTTLYIELNQTKQVYGNAIAKLVKKVKHLENKLKTSKVSRKPRIVLADEEDNLVSEAPSKQGRIEETEVEDVLEERQVFEHDFDLDQTTTLLQQEVTPLKAQLVQDQSTRSFEDDISLLSVAKILAEASTEKIKTYKKRRRSTNNTKISTDEGTAKGIFGTAKDIQGTNEEIARKIQEEEQAKDLDCQEQERINLEAAQQLQRQFDQERQAIDDIDWKTIIEQVQEKQSGSMIRYQALKKKPVTVAQATKNMKIYLKNITGYRMTNFKGMTYDQIRPIFEKEYNKVHTLFQKDPKKIEKKRVAEETLLQESFKKLRTTQASSSEPIQEYSTTEPQELSQEELKKMIHIVPVEEVKVEVLQVKYPIIDWEIHSEVFDREDLDTLWSLVKERITLAEPADDMEKALWVQLKRIYEPDKDDTLWKLQRYMHDPLIWRLYGSCAVHHVSSTRGQDIFMLIEKDYPLTTEVMGLMLSRSLQVEDDNEMAKDLIMKIFREVNKPKES